MLAPADDYDPSATKTRNIKTTQLKTSVWKIYGIIKIVQFKSLDSTGRLKNISALKKTKKKRKTAETINHFWIKPC